MENLQVFAIFLRDYGASAMASVFAFLYLMERRERMQTQASLVLYLVTLSEKSQASAVKISEAALALERALAKDEDGVDQ